MEEYTMMKLKVDLHCQKCYKKVKKVLGKFPEIRDEAYDVNRNIVTIRVVCEKPEKIKDKLYRKGRDFIDSIEIIDEDEEKEKPVVKLYRHEKEQDSGDADASNVQQPTLDNGDLIQDPPEPEADKWVDFIVGMEEPPEPMWPPPSSSSTHVEWSYYYGGYYRRKTIHDNYGFDGRNYSSSYDYHYVFFIFLLAIIMITILNRT